MTAAGAPVVVKLGGSLLEDREARTALLSAIVRASGEAGSLLLVHGGGKRIDAALSARGIPKRTQAGLRVTDAPTLEVVVAVLHTVNRELVDEIAALGAPASGVASPWILRAAVHPPVDGVVLGYVGRVIGVESAALGAARAASPIAVLAPLGVGPDGRALNVNADSAAAAIAAAAGARRLVFLTDVEGVADAGGRRIEQLDAPSARRLLQGSAVSGGMRPKLEACLSAAAAGVGEIVIAGPRRQREALAGGRGGTHVVAA
ncbi:MAG TPA: acetylglutamate kinase [Thermoanaerobaculia bacterium]|nr:acetylglutamate kinase [Thermoanaerobaculia bacterium]